MMIKSHQEIIQKTETIIDDVVCNCCGKSIIELDQNSDYLHIEKSWGYFSPFDLENHKIDICPECYIKWLEYFKIPISKQQVYLCL